MTVFKAYLKIVQKNMVLILLYFGIFSTLTIAMQGVYANKETEKSFVATKLNIALIDQDKSPISKALTSYLGEHHRIKTTEYNKNLLQEEIYYGKLDYVAVIEEGFGTLENDPNQKILVTKKPGDYEGIYMDGQINRFLARWSMLTKAGYQEEEIVEFFKDESKNNHLNNIEMLDLNGNKGQVPGYFFVFRFLPYLFICTLCHIIATVLLQFREKEIRKRMMASCFSLKKQSIQGILGLGCGALFVGLLGFLLPLVLYGKELLSCENLGYYLTNGVFLLMGSFTIAFAVGVIVPSKDILNNVVNVIALGLCFLGGVFVELDMLGEGVKKVSQFLPTYWYERNNDLLGKFAVIEGGVHQTFVEGLFMQGLFALAFMGVALVAIRFERQERI